MSVCLTRSPGLTWRDVQHLTVLTSKRNSLYDAKRRFSWHMNGVGLEFNHLFGFGVLDAGAMVALAKDWVTVPPRYHCEAGMYQTPKYVHYTYVGVHAGLNMSRSGMSKLTYIKYYVDFPDFCCIIHV